MHKKKIKASFFPSIISLQNIDFLRPNKIHVLLSKANSDHLLDLYEEYYSNFLFDKNMEISDIKKNLKINSRFDDYKMRFLKNFVNQH